LKKVAGTRAKIVRKNQPTEKDTFLIGSQNKMEVLKIEQTNKKRYILIGKQAKVKNTEKKNENTDNYNIIDSDNTHLDN